MEKNIEWRWDNATQDVLYAKYITGWTWDDHHTAIDEMLAVREKDKFVYVIVDMSDAPFPKGATITAQARRMPETTLVFIVSSNTFVRIMTNMSVNIRGEGHLYQLVSKLDEAYAGIEAHRKERTHQNS